MKKKVFLLILAALFVALVIFLFNYQPKPLSQGEKEKALENILGRKPNLTGNNAPKGDLEYKGKYYSFMYPAASKKYIDLVNGKPVVFDKSILDSFMFDMSDPNIYIVTEAIQVPSVVAGVSDYPSVKFRQTQPQLYIQSNLNVDNLTGLAFEKNDNSGYEKTGFFYKNGLIYSFSVQSPDAKSASAVFDKIILTLKLF